MAAMSLRSYFQNYVPNVVVVGTTAYGLNPGDVTQNPSKGGTLVITVPQIPLTIEADINQQVDPDADAMVNITARNGSVYLFEGVPKAV